MKAYEYIIAGGGCAGLMLAYYLNKSVLRNKRMLLVDQKFHQINDKNWSFWESGANEFEDLVTRKWNRISFAFGNEINEIQLDTLQYKMIRSADFYRYMYRILKANTTIDWHEGKINGMYDSEEGVILESGDSTFFGSYLFNSLTPDIKTIKQSDYLLFYQHFRGWVIETTLERFNDEVAMLMDFRIDQKGSTRFCYVLPQHKKKALVEYTVFSEHLLDTREYQKELTHYIDAYVKCENYTITEKEFGIIPMTNYPLREYQSRHIMNIGTRSGMVKPSSGYAFTRIQNQARSIVSQLENSGTPFYHKNPFAKRFRLYDTTMLNVLHKKETNPAAIYYTLFKKNAVNRILGFLDERSGLIDEVRIFFSVPLGLFLREMLRSAWQLFKNGLKRH